MRYRNPLPNPNNGERVAFALANIRVQRIDCFSVGWAPCTYAVLSIISYLPEAEHRPRVVGSEGEVQEERPFVSFNVSINKDLLDLITNASKA